MGRIKDQLPNYENHTFYLGKILPDMIDEIGEDIDFVILYSRPPGFTVKRPLSISGWRSAVGICCKFKRRAV